MSNIAEKSSTVKEETGLQCSKVCMYGVDILYDLVSTFGGVHMY